MSKKLATYEAKQVQTVIHQLRNSFQTIHGMKYLFSQVNGRGSIGSTHSAVVHLENPESSLRWYFKYFLGTGTKPKHWMISDYHYLNFTLFQPIKITMGKPSMKMARKTSTFFPLLNPKRLIV